MGRSLGELIKGRLQEMGGKTQADLRKEMAHAGTEVARQQVHAWVNDTRRPSMALLIVLMDALLIPEGERREWLTAASAKVEPANRSPLDEDDVDTVAEGTPAGSL